MIHSHDELAIIVVVSGGRSSYPMETYRRARDLKTSFQEPFETIRT